MPTPTYNGSHTDETYELLLSQFKDKPVIQAVLKTWTDKLQEVEDDLYALMTETLFLVAEGYNLQRYGSLLGVIRPEGITDGAYRELLISEILRRSSDGTPDRIRQILESTTGMRGMRIFEHINEDQLPTVMGSLMVYGYADPNITDFTIDGDEGKYLKWASPICTGSTVIGQHIYGEGSLFIPSEAVNVLGSLHVDLLGDPNTDPDYLTENNDNYIALQQSEFDQYGIGYENAVLPEFSEASELFQVDTLIGPTIEDFNVDTPSGELPYNVDVIGAVDNTKGIMLETAQITLYEEAE